MNNFHHVIINKNRGWRGLAEAIVIGDDYKEQLKIIFSFSQPVWDDLIIKNKIVIPDDKYYYVLTLEHMTGKLPSPSQQRSVLIKDYVGKVVNVNRYEKSEWLKAEADDWSTITHHVKNNNNHTQSDWNCIGIRVMPDI